MHSPRPSDISLPPTEPIDITALVEGFLGEQEPQITGVGSAARSSKFIVGPTRI